MNRMDIWVTILVVGLPIAFVTGDIIYWYSISPYPIAHWMEQPPAYRTMQSVPLYIGTSGVFALAYIMMFKLPWCKDKETVT